MSIRPNMVVGLTILVASLAVVGCGAPAAPEQAEPNASAEPDPTADAECPVDDTNLGAAVSLGVVSDGAGPYCHVTADLDAISLTAHGDIRVGTWSAVGGITWGDSEPSIPANVANEAQKLTARWVVEEFLDGEALDWTSDAYGDWIQSSPLIGDDWRADYSAGWESEGKTNGLTVTPFATPLVRDGPSRVSEITLSPSTTSLFDVKGVQYVQTCFAVTAKYHGADGAD